jgi:hypothetical protein
MVFQRGEDLGADVDTWGEKYWADFDEEWWRQEVQQGRLFRSRIDLFLQYWLTMSVQDEIPAEKVFAHFREYAAPQLTTADKATQLLVRLLRDADTFRGFAELDPSSTPGRFYARVVEGLELGATIPLLLWLISGNHDLPAGAVNRALGAVESWCVRRTLLRTTMKDVNRFVIALIKRLDNLPADRVGEGTAEFLLDQTAESRAWPTDHVHLTGHTVRRSPLRDWWAGSSLPIVPVRNPDQGPMASLHPSRTGSLHRPGQFTSGGAVCPGSARGSPQRPCGALAWRTRRLA